MQFLNYYSAASQTTCAHIYISNKNIVFFYVQPNKTIKVATTCLNNVKKKQQTIL